MYKLIPTLVLEMGRKEKVEKGFLAYAKSKLMIVVQIPWSQICLRFSFTPFFHPLREIQRVTVAQGLRFALKIEIV